jgi:hypothetical protein
MVILSEYLKIDTFLKSLLVFICVSLVLFLANKIFSKKFATKYHKFKKTSILIFALFVTLLYSSLSLIYMKAAGQRDMAAVFKNMSIADRIDLEFWGYSIDHREILENLMIVDKFKISQLTDFMKGLNYFLVSSKTITLTGERMNINIWKGNNKICELKIRLYLLDTQGFEYMCSEKLLFYKIVELIKSEND